MVKWTGTFCIIGGLLLATMGYIPLCFAVGTVGSALWLIESKGDLPLLTLNLVVTILNFTAFLNN